MSINFPASHAVGSGSSSSSKRIKTSEGDEALFPNSATTQQTGQSLDKDTVQLSTTTTAQAAGPKTDKDIAQSLEQRRLSVQKFLAVLNSDEPAQILATLENAGLDLNAFKKGCIETSEIAQKLKLNEQEIRQSELEHKLVQVRQNLANHNQTDSLGRTALYYAAVQNKPDQVNALLQNKWADPNKTDRVHGQTVLCAAVQNGADLEIIQALLDHWADPNIADQYGNTPIYYAQEKPDVYRALLDRGADHVGVRRLKDEDQCSSTSAQAAGTETDTDMTPSPKQQFLAALNIKNSALFSKTLENLGIDVDAFKKGEVPAFGLAQQLELNNQEISLSELEHKLVQMQLKLNNWADPNETDSLGQTSLHHAVREGTPDVVQALLQDRRVNVHKADNMGKTALHLAVLRDDDLTRGVITQALLDKGADPNHADNLGWTALHTAASAGHSDLFPMLLGNGADVNKLDTFGRNPLHCAAITNEWLAIRPLLARGANPNIADKDGKTPLDLAAERGYSQLVDLLKPELAKTEK
jgi:ankyrin repeat protein